MSSLVPTYRIAALATLHLLAIANFHHLFNNVIITVKFIVSNLKTDTSVITSHFRISLGKFQNVISHITKLALDKQSVAILTAYLKFPYKLRAKICQNST